MFKSSESDDSNLGVNERNHDVSGSLGCVKALVIMGESAWMHQHPTFAGVQYTAIVPQKFATAALLRTMVLVKMQHMICLKKY